MKSTITKRQTVKIWVTLTSNEVEIDDNSHLIPVDSICSHLEIDRDILADPIGIYYQLPEHLQDYSIHEWGIYNSDLTEF